MAEALFAVEQSAYAGTIFLRLIQKLLRQITGSEVPEVLTTDKGVRKGQQSGFLSAVAGQRECGNTGNIDTAALAGAKHGIKHIILRAEHAAGLYVDGDLAVR